MQLEYNFLILTRIFSLSLPYFLTIALESKSGWAKVRWRGPDLASGGSKYRKPKTYFQILISIWDSGFIEDNCPSELKPDENKIRV